MCAFSPCARFLRPTQVRSPPSSTACRSTVGPNGDYYVPSLGVKVTAIGPLARRIVDTLTHSSLLATGCMSAKPQRGLHRPISGAVLITAVVTVDATHHILSRVIEVVACGN